jgi:hypothetical protein
MKTFMLDAREIHRLTDFLRNHKAHVTRLKKTQMPEVLYSERQGGTGRAGCG